MAAQRRTGTTPVDRFGARFDADLVCPACGHEDAGGRWRARATGGRVRYRHVCPSCGAERSRTLRFV